LEHRGRALLRRGDAYHIEHPPELTITDGWLKVFTAGYVLVGIGILVEVARRLGMGFITARAEMEKSKAAAKTEAATGAGSPSA
jgi:hypothetical protein